MSPHPSDLGERGPFAVGVVQTEIHSKDDPLDRDRRLPTEIWYPAEATGPDGAEAPLAPHPLGLPHHATANLDPIDAALPLIAFSHGNSGLRQQSTFLTTYLASWGYVVAAPDHVGNTFSEMLGLSTEEERRDVHLRARQQRPQDILATIHALLDHGHAEQSLPRLPRLRPDALGVLGHSYGGWTSLKLPALEPRVRAVCCLAPASEPFVGRKAFDPEELPVPSSVSALVLAARDDVLVDLETSILPLYARLGPTADLETVEGADHFHFCDGLELLHKMHENNPRPGQARPTRPFSELRGEAETHAFLCERVGRFFAESLGLPNADGRTGEKPSSHEGTRA